MERKLKAQRRDGAGKGVARKIRTAGGVPGIVYGHGIEPMSVSVDARELFHTLHTEAGANVLIDLRVDGDHFLAMPREIQRDHLRGRVLHVDFLRIARDEKITVEVPIQLIGESRGVKEGGVVEHHLWEIQIECFPQDVPATIDADVADLGIGDSIKVSDLRLPAKLTVLTSVDEVIAAVVTPQVLQVEEELPAELAAEAVEGAAPGEGVPEGAGPAESGS